MPEKESLNISNSETLTAIEINQDSVETRQQSGIRFCQEQTNHVLIVLKKFKSEVVPKYYDYGFEVLYNAWDSTISSFIKTFKKRQKLNKAYFED